MSPLVAHSIVVTGRVQGVGFRPFVSRIAHASAITGWVRNRSGTVEIWAEGSREALAAFECALVGTPPPLARPEPPQIQEGTPLGLSAFVIEDSEPSGRRDIHIPPDHFVCDDCLAEMQGPTERRFRYPFINCTQCGPRYTLIDRLPYDRLYTAMRDFPLCADCLAEYRDPVDRRYHAEPLACPACGPSLLFREHGGTDIHGNAPALEACLHRLRQGAIIAIKGIGGYHLVCDARDEAAVTRLRARKGRPAKPLAILVPWRGEDGLETVRAIAEPHAVECDLLQSPLRPIVLMKKRAQVPLAIAIAPHLDEIGVMLPYSPLHHLLADAYAQPLVATSANLSGEPVLTEGVDVEERLGNVCDGFLHHDRPIRRPADDSVFRRIAGQCRPIRLGRGVAPLEWSLPFELPEPCLAVGGDLKNTVALGFGHRVVVSPHLGDLGSVRGSDVFEQIIDDLTRLYQVQPERILCDAHPDYRSARWARAQGLPVQTVFHHHAHASALAGEHRVAGELLVFAWDGTGYGEDATIWGGEALVGRPGHWQRAGCLQPFHLAGGDRVSRAPWRSAAILCWEAGIEWRDCPREASLLRQAWRRRINSPRSTSAGRLFDGAAALLGLAVETSFEGQAAMYLEAQSDSEGEVLALPLTDRSGLSWIDWAPLLRALLDETRSVRQRASLFHASLAAAIAAQAEVVRDRTGIRQVGLVGGVFQNRILTEQAMHRLAERGFEVSLPAQIPTNDAGLCFGQIIEYAASAMRYR